MPNDIQTPEERREAHRQQVYRLYLRRLRSLPRHAYTGEREQRECDDAYVKLALYRCKHGV